MKYASLISQPVPQTQPLNDRQVKNNAGGYVFQIDAFARLNRFLILGSDSNTYYQKARDLTRENAKSITECLDKDASKTIQTIVNISLAGRAPKNDPAIFALAMASTHADVRIRSMALSELQNVCRTATHLFQFLEARKALGGGKGGRMLHRAVSKWYNEKSVDAVAFQMIKYRERNGWSHKNVHQLHHPSAISRIDTDGHASRCALYKWARGLSYDSHALPDKILAFNRVQEDVTKKYRLELIKAHKLPWEALPTECNSDPDYWAAQLPEMGLTALIRNLGNMSRIGLIKPLSEAERLIVTRLKDVAALRKARIHPFNILVALKTYASGNGFRGGNSWPVSQPIVAALDKAFYLCFANVVPTGKRHYIGIDVSASMGASIMNTNLTCCEASAALALVTANIEDSTYLMMFDQGVRPANIRTSDSLEEAARKIRSINGGGTDCALPMIDALKKKIEVDTFVVLTDNETWAGRSHPVAALKEYRQKMKINAKLIVVGMTSTGFSIADPNDPGMLDIVGFDSAAPAVMAEFSRN